MSKAAVLHRNRITFPFASLTTALASIYFLAAKVLIPFGIGNGNVLLLLLGLLTLINFIADKGSIRFDKFMVIEVVFITVTLVTGYFVADSTTEVIETAKSMIYGMLYGYVVIRIVQRNNSVDWLIYTWIISGVGMAIYIVLGGGYASGKLTRVSVNESLNVNTLGVFLMFSVWCVLYLLSTRKLTIKLIVVMIVAIALMIYVIYGTASRKALIGTFFTILAYGIFCALPTLKKLSIFRRITVLVMSVTLIALILYRFGDAFERMSSSMTYRMSRLTDDGITSTGRLSLIKDAINVFWRYPVFGVGWNNYRYYSVFGLYSHCTYAEVLACTGLFGSVFAYGLWIILTKRIVRLKNHTSKPFHFITMILFMLLLFIDAMQIMYYNSTLLLVMHLLLALSYIAEDNDHAKDVVVGRIWR